MISPRMLNYDVILENIYILRKYIIPRAKDAKKLGKFRYIIFLAQYSLNSLANPESTNCFERVIMIASQKNESQAFLFFKTSSHPMICNAINTKSATNATNAAGIRKDEPKNQNPRHAVSIPDKSNSLFDSGPIFFSLMVIFSRMSDG